MLWLIIIAVAAVYGIICVYVYFAQDSMVFFPTDDFVVNPDDVNLQHEELFIRVGTDDSIHGWFFPVQSETPVSKTILFCHGNAGNISYRMQTVLFLLQRNVNVLIFDYRGYGRSSGKPTEINTYDDALAAYNWLIDVKAFDAEDIIVFGRSLGGAVAVDLASKRKCGGLMVESSFASAKEMAKEFYPLFPIALLLKYSFDSISKIPDVKCPILFIHSPDDELIPYKQGRRLYDAAPEPKRFYDTFGGHNQRGFFDDPGYKAAIEEFALGT